MPIDLKTLGSKLARYREQLTEGVNEVAAATGIDAAKLILIERGETEPTGDEVLILADHYRCDFKFFISNERVAPFEQTDTLYRAHGADFTKADRRSVQDFLYLCETEAFLMSELDRPRRAFAFAPSGTYFKGHGEAAAAKLREAFGYANNELPRDIYADMRELGVHVFRRRLGRSDISGLFVNHPVAGRSALVNLSEDVYRQRFSAAHELAHAVFDADAGPSVSYDRPAGGNFLEIRANRFASCLLMPPGFLAKLPDPSKWSDGDALHWANEMRVSCSSLGIALKEAKLVDEAQASRIRALRVPAQAKVDPELPESLSATQRARKGRLLELGLSNHYVALCFDGFQADKISIGRLAEALLCTRGELGELAQLYGRTLRVD